MVLLIHRLLYIKRNFVGIFCDEFVYKNALISGNNGPIWIIIFVLNSEFIGEGLYVIKIKHRTITNRSRAVV